MEGVAGVGGQLLVVKMDANVVLAKAAHSDDDDERSDKGDEAPDEDGEPLYDDEQELLLK